MRLLFSIGFRFLTAGIVAAGVVAALSLVGISTPILATSLLFGAGFSSLTTAANIAKDLKAPTPSAEQWEIETERNRPLVNLEDKILGSISNKLNKPSVKSYNQNDLIEKNDSVKTKKVAKQNTKKQELKNQDELNI